MRIVILSQWFDPEPAFKGLPFAKALREAGHDVQVITGFPNYPGGTLYPGYKVRLWQREVLEGIPVLRVALYPSHDRSRLGRILNYASFAFSAAILGPCLIRSADVVYVYHPPATIGLPAFALRVFRGMRIVYDIQDLWPDTLASTGMVRNQWMLKLVGWWCKFVYAFATRITVLSSGFKEHLIQRGVPADKVTVIRNWCDSACVQCADNSDQNLFAAEFVILFAGNMGAAQALDSVLEAAKLLNDEASPARFIFVGGGVEAPRLEKSADDRELKNVTFLARRPPREMGSLYRRANALLVHLRDDPLFRVTIPSKTQAYLAAGKPILMGVRGDAAELVRQAGAGITFQPENPRSLAEAVRNLIGMPEEERSKMGDAGRAFYDQELSLERGVAHFVREFESAVASRSRKSVSVDPFAVSARK